MYFALRPMAMSPSISASRGVKPFSSASLRQYASISDGIASSSVSASARARGSSARLSSSRGCFLFGTPRSSCLPTLKKYSAVSAPAVQKNCGSRPSAVSAPATASAHDEKLSVDTRAISWPMHMASNISPTANPRMAYTESRMS